MLSGALFAVLEWCDAKIFFEAPVETCKVGIARLYAGIFYGDVLQQELACSFHPDSYNELLYGEAVVVLQ